MVAILLRFYKLSDLFFFNIDEERLNFIVRRIVIDHRPVLTGWEIPGGISVPPINYYFGALVMLISGNNLLGYAIIASLFGVLGVPLTYFVGKKIFKSEKIGIYSSLLYCFSYLVNIYNRLSINLLFGPILSLLTYLSLYQIIINKSKRWLLILALILIFSTQEGSMISLIFLSIISLIIFKVKFKIKDYFLPLIIFTSSFIPIFIFDLRHNFQVLKKIISFFGSARIGGTNLRIPWEHFNLCFRTFARFLWPTGPHNLNMQILPCNDYSQAINKATPVFFSLIGFLVIIFFILKSISRKASFGQKIILLHLLIILFGMTIYSLINPGYLYEWFFLIATPAFSFIAAYLIIKCQTPLIGRILTLILLTLFIFINLLFISTTVTTVGYKDKISAVKYSINLLDSKNFSLEMIGNGCNGYGYRYLFTHLGKEPTTSYVDNIYGRWLYNLNNREPSENKIVLVPLMDLNSNDLQEKYRQLKKDSFINKKFGNLEVLYIQKVD